MPSWVAAKPAPSSGTAAWERSKDRVHTILTELMSLPGWELWPQLTSLSSQISPTTGTSPKGSRAKLRAARADALPPPCIRDLPGEKQRAGLMDRGDRVRHSADRRLTRAFRRSGRQTGVTGRYRASDTTGDLLERAGQSLGIAAATYDTGLSPRPLKCE